MVHQAFIQTADERIGAETNRDKKTAIYWL
jgi:hypothetical protein